MPDALASAVHPEYALPVLAGLALAVLFPASRGIRPDPLTRARYRLIQVLTLIGALVGAKLAALVGDLRFPLEPLPEGAIWLVGRSITGALLFGYLTAETLKPMFGYREPPNDRFACVLPFSIAIGRVGCLLAGCCGGIATRCPIALPDAAGVMRHPTALYDLLFHVALGAVFVALLRRGALRGRLFALHMLSYGVFRFFIEMIRESREYVGGVSAYQLFALALVACGVFGMMRELPAADPAPPAPAMQ